MSGAGNRFSYSDWRGADAESFLIDGLTGDGGLTAGTGSAGVSSKGINSASTTLHSTTLSCCTANKCLWDKRAGTQAALGCVAYPENKEL